LTFSYLLNEPGFYALAFLYHYMGPDGGKLDVLRSKLLSNTVTFTVR
jgi:hypothetical protein